MKATRSTLQAGAMQAGQSLDAGAAALLRARTILNHAAANEAPALALQLVGGTMPTEAAVTALEKATAPTDLIATAKAMGLA